MSIQHLLEGSASPPFLASAPLETARFGILTGRADLGELRHGDRAALLDEISTSEFQLIVLRYPAQETHLFAELIRTPFQVIHADSLIYAVKQLDETARDDIDGCDRRLAEPGDLTTLTGLIGEVFDRYGGHYSANPLLAPEQIREGYIEWGLSFMNAPERELWVLSQPGSPELSAFACVDLSDPGEMALNGVRPSDRSRGWAGRSYAVAERRLAETGREAAWSSTQIHNLLAQRTWRTRGYSPRFTFQTVHLVQQDLWDRALT